LGVVFSPHVARLTRPTAVRKVKKLVKERALEDAD
jgi:hypothetical protein